MIGVVAGTTRGSSASTARMVRVRNLFGGRLGLADKPKRKPFRSQEENPMMMLLSSTGLQSNEDAIRPGAQTERRGGAEPLADSLRFRTG
jgi:hypothetical protein